MKKKIANALEIILLIIALILLWLPTLGVQHVDTVSYLPVKTHVIGLAPRGNVYIICLLFVINILMCLISIIAKKEHRDGKMHIIMPILLLMYCGGLITRVGSVTSDETWVIVESTFPNWLFFICIFGSIFISIIKRSTIIAGLPTHNVNVENVSQADEIKKYKELLDSGAISQEEFDSKKKQLLKK